MIHCYPNIYKEMFPQANKDDVKKKFNFLRTNYRMELKKHVQSMKSGCGTDDIYQPTLWYYNEMATCIIASHVSIIIKERLCGEIAL